MMATTWLRISAPTPTPSAPTSAATTRLRHSTSTRSETGTVSKPRADRMTVPTSMIVSVTMSDSRAPAAA